MDAQDQLESVSQYYGKVLKNSSDLRTSACCPIDSLPKSHAAILQKLHPEVTSRFYGCGSPIPSLLSGTTLLDLGCGTGRDVYLASALVGSSGSVIGVDMTEEQLDVARAHLDFHAHAFFGEGAQSNVQFRHGVIEDLASAGIQDSSVDIVISNCVCNLSPDKHAVFSEVARVLREGGEFYFSDVYADRRLTDEAKKNEVLVAECLGGALYIEDFRRIMAEVGLPDVRVVSCGTIQVHDDELKKLVPDVQFYSITIRAFKIHGLEDRRENYGEIAELSSGCSSEVTLDVDFKFKKHVATPVDKNTAAILRQSRFSKLFTVSDMGGHKGLLAPKVECSAFRASIAKDGAVCTPSETNGKEGENGAVGENGKEGARVSGGCC